MAIGESCRGKKVGKEIEKRQKKKEKLGQEVKELTRKGFREQCVSIVS